MKHRVVVALTLGFSLSAFAQQLPPAEISIERFYQFPVLNGRSPTTPAMSPDGYKIVFGWNQTGDRRLDVWVLEYPHGKPKKIVDAATIERLPNQDDKRTDDDKQKEQLYDAGISGFVWSPDSREVCFSYKGRAWLMDPMGNQLRPVFDANEGSYGFQYSPDGQYLSFQKGQNLYRLNRKTGAIKQLTFLSAPNTNIESYLWSPDSKNVAMIWSDSSKLGRHVMMDFTKDRAEVRSIQRMWNGELSQDNQIGVVGADGGLVKFVEGLPRYMWPSDLAWSPDGSMLAYGWFKDDFKEYTINAVPITTMKKADAYHETAPKNYIPDFRKVFWTRDSKRILFTTDILNGQFGFRSLLSVEPNGKNLLKVYAEQHDIAAATRPKNSDRLLLVTMGRSPLKTEITIQEPDGKRKVIVPEEDGFATPVDFDDAQLPLFSDNGMQIATLASNPTRNNELYSVLPELKRLTVSQRPEFAKIKWAEFKEVSFPAPDGRMIHATLVQKPGLDTSKKHPAFLSNIYANSGKMAWGGYFENYAAMELDMVVLKVDFRASWGYGGEFNSGYYRQMGLIDADEAVAAKNYLASLGYVDPDRVGIWGWSYGGYLTCMTLLTKPGVFHAGVAVASVTDWKTYNEWYTRRRLGLVKDDKEIFEKTSPITYADGLKDNLLLVHGILDDNVLFQDTARLMQRMIEKGKYFDLMAYPEDDHSIGKNWSRPHVFATVMRYLYGKLGK